eukprot:CAMPEP_0177634630 /NCGR_PEP_ID=MMETSP0447-20121125/3469_1 /TAXON_ID=0 /ORGANISM="Stygamoeba regulata, Strain BSH-02190019" /LENGTH=738 /DNA_ID=CAMNT_0019136361 /DNA_START=709 /DNA_END=2925 /DNA_ORIENTATION=+
MANEAITRCRHIISSLEQDYEARLQSRAASGHTSSSSSSSSSHPSALGTVAKKKKNTSSSTGTLSSANTPLYGPATEDGPNPAVLEALTDAERRTTEEDARWMRRVLLDLDDMSDTICRVIDSAELCRNVHASADFRDAASNVCLQMSSYIHRLNANTLLYQLLEVYRTNPAVQGFLTAEENTVASLHQAEFEASGIHLPDEQRNEIVQLQERISNLTLSFGQVANNSPPMAVEVPRSAMSRLPKTFMLDDLPSGSSPDSVVLACDGERANAVLKWSQHAETRKQVFIASNMRAPENLEILDQLLRTRTELAKRLGYNSYASLVLRANVAKSPEVVQVFLTDLWRGLQRKAHAEMELLSEEKRKWEPNEPSAIYGWDRGFYTGVTKAKKHELNGATLAEYFSLGNVLDGLATVCDHVFGVKMRIVGAHATELWSSDVIKVEFSNEEEGVLGYCYLDLLRRDGKSNQAANFGIEFGRIERNDQFRLPRWAIICSFARPSLRRPTLLTHSDVETLFHEFGHSLHLLFSRTRFQHTSGTRCAVDLVETPSTLMEFFVWDPRILPLFAKHYKTGKPLPASMIRNLRASKNMFSAIDTQHQVLLSLLDQTFHHLYATKDHPKTASGNPETTVDMLRRLQNMYTTIPFEEHTHWHTHFSHLTTYAGSYYTYLFCRVFSTSLWYKYFQKDPLSREAGNKLRSELLRYGGSKDPQSILRTLVGAPSVKDFIRSMQEEIEVTENSEA